MEEINDDKEFDVHYSANMLINKKINLHTSFPYNSQLRNKRGVKSNSFEIKDCNFIEKVSVRSFAKRSIGTTERYDTLIFDKCEFYGIVDMNHSKIDAKVRFRNCQFHNEVKMSNTTFLHLADFWRCQFHKRMIFYKTDFMAVTVFSGVTFHENVLFTYSLINKLIIFRGTMFKKGVDLSLAVISGNLSVFDIQLDSKKYKSVLDIKDDDDFEDAVSTRGDIPIKNKRESFRIFKKYYESNSNVVESLPYAVWEKETLAKENWHELYKMSPEIKGIKSSLVWFLRKVKAFFNLIVLGANYLSNYFGVAYIQSIAFTLLIGAICYYITILNTDKYIFALHFDWSILKSNIPSYANYLLPTHKFDFLGEEFHNNYNISNWFYVWDIAGRMAIGYGIYQTIQAFRKFR